MLASGGRSSAARHISPLVVGVTVSVRLGCSISRAITRPARSARRARAFGSRSISRLMAVSALKRKAVEIMGARAVGYGSQPVGQGNAHTDATDRAIVVDQAFP